MAHVTFSRVFGLGVLAAMACMPGAEETVGPDDDLALGAESASEAEVPGEASDSSVSGVVPMLPAVGWAAGEGGERSRMVASESSTGAARCADGPPSLEAETIDPALPSAGARMLVPRGDDWAALPLQETRFDSVVVGTVAETTVTQVFHNPFKETIDGVYTFPLADDGAVDDYAIRIGARIIRGEMKERGEARRIYEKARKEGRRAGLLEQERTNIFTQSLANIAPGESIEVTIHVVQPVHQERGRFELALPTMVGERYVPAGTEGARLNPPPGAAQLHRCAPLGVSVAIESGALGVQGLASKYHTVDVDRQEDGVLVELAQAGELLSRDFVLSWGLRGDAPQASLVAQADRRGEGGHFTLTIVPPKTVAAEQVRGRELIFVIDSSGSMRGVPLETAKATVNHALEHMNPEDRFQILNFSRSASSLGPAPIANTPATRVQAKRYLDEVVSMGGTEMLSGIRAALGMPHDEERLRMVLFLTDGYIGNEQEIFRALEEDIGGARLFSLGVGSSVNRHLLEGMAKFGRGAVTYMGPGESPKSAVEHFYDRIDDPVLTDIAVDWGGLDVDAVLPSRIPDLFSGQPVVVYGRYAGAPSGTVHLKGRQAGEEVRIPVEVDFSRAENASGLASMWARQQIDEWLGAERLRPENDKMRGLVTALAIERRIMTEYTAFVAVDNAASGQGDPSEDVDMGARSAGALGLMGTGMGGGGTGEGTIGLGNFGLIGRGGGRGSGYGTGSGAGFGGRGARVPRVRQAKATVVGSIDKDMIRRIVRAHINEVRHCYNLGLAKDPNLKGRLAIRFVLGGAGEVSTSTVAMSIGDEEVDRCVAAAVKRWKFPHGCGNSIVTYPFVLEPG